MKHRFTYYTTILFAFFLALTALGCAYLFLSLTKLERELASEKRYSDELTISYLELKYQHTLLVSRLDLFETKLAGMDAKLKPAKPKKKRAKKLLFVTSKTYLP